MEKWKQFEGASKMLDNDKITALLAIALIAAIASVLYRRRRRPTAGRWRCSDFDAKPQNRFKRLHADNSYSPFAHLQRDGKEHKEFSSKIHPYEEEITTLLEHPPPPPMMMSSLTGGDSSYTWVDTETQLERLAELLSKVHVFAVDTEQHSLRSFLGFTALMQISTQKEDFLVDTIALHDVMGILRPVFADPSVCKVFHGADNDVLWLQRDFHIYVVNMFDTAKACEVLSKPYKSLGYLLEIYCGVSSDKTLQREDWRLRPLTEDMIQYARNDAHYLLYIANCLVSELREKPLDTSTSLDDKFNFFFEASRRSNMVSLQLYVKDNDSFPGASAARKLNIQGTTSRDGFEAKDLICKLCAWRDLMARIHDESLRYILSDHAIVDISAKVPKNPVEVYDIIVQADLNNSSSINLSLPSPSLVVSTHSNEICRLLQEVNANLADVLGGFLQKHLEPTGCCPISIYNYSLLSEFSLKQTSTLFSKQNGGKHAAPVGRKASRELFVQKFSCKSPVYHNCRIYASDGRLLCYCDRRKLEWYLRRDLAKFVEEDPPAIMLLFEPKGRPEDEDNDFYIQSKKNICVVCGEKSHYLRYRIIPACYRMHFPEHLKSHRSHDIVLLCVDCHEVAHSAAEKYKKQVAAEFSIPLFVQKIVDSGGSEVVNLTSESIGGVEEKGVSPLLLRTAAMALLRHGSDMPSKRHDELMQIVRTYFGGRDISPKELEIALLVGMSPQERRRLEKKKGLPFKHYGGSAIHSISGSTFVKENNSMSQELSKNGFVMDIDVEATNTSKCGLFVGPLTDEDSCVDEQMLYKRETIEQENACMLDNDNVSVDLLEATSGSSQAYRLNQVSSWKRYKKLSLLGHGLHGKQVVEHLLREYGEDGICEFCQKWRQIFVEATHPRYLPSGWDVMHSGRREFGEYSVYNPVKKAL